jgi:2-oxoisovalerate dehydrogenase E2 component (dihydrolipoyl transacylase)
VSSAQVSSKPDTKPSTVSAQPVVNHQQPTANREIGFISPVVAKIAAEHGVNLQQVQGTGLNGRVTKNDVLNFVESGKSTALQPAQAATPVVTPIVGDKLIKHTVIRKQIAEHMLMSKHTSPHVLTVMEADMSRVAKHRSANKEIFARDGVNLTFTVYFMMAIVAGLKAYPIVNSSWTEEGVRKVYLFIEP